LPGRALQGSALAMPFPDGTFDFLVSIGCMHHTGNLQQCFDETFRVLRPGGVAVIMVYNRFSYTRWRQAPWTTTTAFVRSIFGQSAETSGASSCERSRYDHNSHGEAAPETAFASARELKAMLAAFAPVSCSKRNADALALFGVRLLPRRWLLPTLGRWLGLDVYVEAKKPLLSVSYAAAA
jgi:SAM-dependent methyltransferase